MRGYQNVNLSTKDRPTRADTQSMVDDTFDARHGTDVIDAICDFTEKVDRDLNIRFHNHTRGKGYSLPTILKYHSEKYEEIRKEVLRNNRL